MPKLTAASALALKPKKERYEVSDAHPGLRLVVYPTNRKVWIWRFRKPGCGTSAKLTLGPLDYANESLSEPKLGTPLTLQAARALASEALNHMEKRRITSLVVVDEAQKVLGVVHLHSLWTLELM